MKQRKLVIGLLIMVALVVSTFTFAFWAGSYDWSDEVTNGTIVIGSGREVSVEVTPQAATSQSLVPVGFINQSNEANATDTYELFFNVIWNDSAAFASTSTLTITISGLSITGVDEEDFNTYNLGSLFLFTVVGGSGEDNNELSITKNTLLEDIELNVQLVAEDLISEDQYGFIASGTLNFTVTFTVTEITNPALD